MLVLVRHVAPLECTQSAGGVLNFVVGTVCQSEKTECQFKHLEIKLNVKKLLNNIW